MGLIPATGGFGVDLGTRDGQLSYWWRAHITSNDSIMIVQWNTDGRVKKRLD